MSMYTQIPQVSARAKPPRTLRRLLLAVQLRVHRVVVEPLAPKVDEDALPGVGHGEDVAGPDDDAAVADAHRVVVACARSRRRFDAARIYGGRTDRVELAEWLVLRARDVIIPQFRNFGNYSAIPQFCLF